MNNAQGHSEINFEFTQAANPYFTQQKKEGSDPTLMHLLTLACEQLCSRGSAVARSKESIAVSSW